MARTVAMSAFSPCFRGVVSQPLAVSLVVLACLAGHALGSCLSYGHSCWGAHGKRSGGPILGEGPLAADGRSGPLSPLSSSSSPSSSSTPESDSDALWILSKMMAKKELDQEGKGLEQEHTLEPKQFNIWQRLLDVKKMERKSEGPAQVDGAGKTSLHPSSSEGLSAQSDSAYEGDGDNSQSVDEMERRNMLSASGENRDREDEDDELEQREEGDDEPIYGDDEELDAENGGSRTDGGRRYRYKLQKHWANRIKNKKNHRPYYYYYPYYRY